MALSGEEEMYGEGRRDGYAAAQARIAELEAFKAEALARLDRLSMALTRIECETPDDWIRNIARDALYQKTPSQ
jgi:hypothetical protein